MREEKFTLAQLGRCVACGLSVWVCDRDIHPIRVHASNGTATNKMPVHGISLLAEFIQFWRCIFFVFLGTSNTLIAGRASTRSRLKLSRLQPNAYGEEESKERKQTYLHYLTIFPTIITCSKLLCLFRIWAGCGGEREIMLQIFTSISYTRQCIVFRAVHWTYRHIEWTIRVRRASGLVWVRTVEIDLLAVYVLGNSLPMHISSKQRFW